MSDFSLNPNEYLTEKKKFINRQAIFPNANESIKLEGTGLKTSAEYIMDINRKRCMLSRITFQNRCFTSIVLLRLDIDTKPHCNPDNEVIKGTHLHILQGV